MPNLPFAKIMRHFILIALLFSGTGNADARTPLPDSSPAFFSGEWHGTLEQGGYCYLNLTADGRGYVLIDSGIGDWLGAKLQWHNQQQALVIEKITPLPAAPRQRMMPLATFVLRARFNQTLTLSWGSLSGDCHLQKIEATARHLERARTAVGELLTEQSK